MEKNGKQSLQRFLIVNLIGALLTITIVFLGAPVLRVIRKIYGPLKFWSAGFAMAAGLWFFQPSAAFMFLAIWTTLGLYTELEENGRAGFGSGCISILAGSMLLLGSPYLNEFKANLQGAVQKVGQESSALGIDAAQVLANVSPSALVMVLMFSLAFALGLEQKVAQILGFRMNRTATGLRPLEFKAPDFVIWVLMISFLFSFLQLETIADFKFVAINFLIVTSGVFFLQGFAVVEMALLYFRVTGLLKLLFYFLVLIGQLFILFLAVGILDYWLDFRGRLKRRMLQKKSSTES